jgi:hypothetical protein
VILNGSLMVAETRHVRMRMKNRWIGGFALAMILALAACAPPSQGGGGSTAPSQAAPASDAAPASAEPMPSEEPAESEDPADRYNY